MSFTIPNINNKKTTLICFSTGIYEKKYLSAILENNKENIDYFYNDSELNQLDKRHRDEDKADKAIEEISQIIKIRLDTLLSFGDQNSNYILVIITDCDKAPFDAFNKLKNNIKELKCYIEDEICIQIDYYFVFSYRGFEDWIKFYLENGASVSNLQSIKENIKFMINEKDTNIFSRHKEAITYYKQFTNSNSQLDDYETINNYPYSDFPYFLEYLEEKYHITL